MRSYKLLQTKLINLIGRRKCSVGRLLVTHCGNRYAHISPNCIHSMVHSHIHVNWFKISEKLAPYLRLYESAAEFLEKRDLWLSSQIGTHDPEVIDNDVTNLFRTVFKLEKTFNDIPVVRDMVVQVSDVICPQR